jgi:hypothetical protein
MLLTLELITKGFVSSFEEEEYELTKIFYNEPDLEAEDGDEDRDKTNSNGSPEVDREILDDENDSWFVREFF